ncbi:tyrosine-type recombinase/integrase [Streptomyces sp. N2-109]|uniref:Tyrosine-type recombinase/integrase n=1 Tax=Streptomyces gossypii TaxID=2883101 RepID=A0ABT2JKV3_9ACTN|nr:tyrosine-type recombinase/integrase [Streptomyces gossypii]MCT2588507.1 tyrosine-type recombinase/integrase [Streptomyces gossypii]
MPYPDLFRRSWNRSIARLGLPPYTPHGLRHTWATVTLTNGVALHEVSRWLGHRSIKVTVDQYGHLTQDGRQRCRQVVDETYVEYMPVSPVSTPRTRAAPGAGLVTDRRGSRCSTPRPCRS